MLSLRKYLFIVAPFFFFSMEGTAQTKDPVIDKEKIRIFRQALDSLPIYLKEGRVMIHQTCRLPSHTNYHIATSNKTFLGTALKLPAKHRNSYINMYALVDMATDHYERRSYDSATRYWKMGLDTAIQFGFEAEELHSIRMALNNNCFLQGDYTGAMKISTEGLTRAENARDTNRMAHFNNVIGYIYMKLRNTTKAGHYFNDQLHNSRDIQDSVQEAHALYNLGDLAIIKREYDSAIHYFTRSMNVYASIKNAELFNHTAKRAYVFNKLAQCWKLKGDLSRALYYIGPALESTTMRTSVNLYDKADYFINAGDIYNRMKKPDSAMILLRKGLSIAVDIHHQEFTRDAFEQLALLFSQKKMYDSAFIYQQHFSKLRDSIANEISSEEIYQRDADLQIERQQQLQQLALEKQRIWRNIIIGVAVVLLLAIVFLYNRYQLKQKNKYQKELNRQQVELFNAIAATQEQERKRIAQDIHDSLGSVLSAAKLKLAEAKELKPELATDEKFLTGINLLDEASAELRSISHNIMPATLSKLGLVPALKNLSEKISSGKGLQVTFSAHEFDTRLDEQTEISIYRIILELINNIVKHAEATKATVQLVKFPDNINITVEDNGKGFDFSKVSQEKKGIGLGNVFSRVEYMNGVANVDAVAGSGTTVIIDIPVGRS